MNKSAPHRRWFSGWRAAARPDEDDAADYGTAFGLDMSLPDAIEPAIAPVIAPVIAASTPAPKNQSKPGPGWVQRLALRRKPAI